MAEQLPVEFDPSRLGAANAVFESRLPVAHFHRLCEALTRPDGEIEVTAQFRLEDGRRPVVTGHLKGELWMTCQRCLSEFAYPLESDYSLAFVLSEEQADALPDIYEAVMRDERGRVRTTDMLEDELLLQLPIVPKHADEHDCGAQFVYKAQPTETKPQSTRKNPFASLAGLKTND